MSIAPVLGIDWGTTAVKTVAIVPSRQRIHLTGYAIVERGPTPSESVVSGSKALRQAIHKTSPSNQVQKAATVLADTDVLTEVFNLPAALDEQAIEARVALRINTALKKSADELCYDYRCEPSASEDETTITLVTARQETVDQRTQPINAAGLDCQLVDLESHAIARVIAQTTAPTHSDALGLVDLGSQLRLAVIHNQQPIFQHTVNKKLSADPEVLIEAITRALALYQGHEQAQPLAKIWLLGGHSNHALSERLSTQIGVPTQCLADVVTVEPGAEIDRSGWQAALPRLMTALGAALHLGDPDAHWH